MVKQLNYVWLTAEITVWQLENTLSTLIAFAAFTTLSIRSVKSSFIVMLHVT